MKEIQTYTLPNGLRIVAAPSATDVVYCGIAVDAGTRDELSGEEGMAHFTEHLTFKGTHRRRSWHINNRMEAVGGDLNAFTGKEETVYYCTFLKQHFARAIDLLMDVVLCSVYPQNEMDKEVEVVIDEIESYNDSPSDLIYDEFENLLFQGHPLGHNILGEAAGLRKMKSEDIQRFVKRLYTPDRMVVFVLGNVPMKTILREVEKGLRRAALENTINAEEMGSPVISKRAMKWTIPANPAIREVIRHKDTHQAHVMIGRSVCAATDKLYLPLYFLSNMLGGPGMNSRLNLALREHNGLVYTVESSCTPYTDAGVWCVYFGCDPEDVGHCKRLVLRELKRFVDSPLTATQLAAAKRQMIGQIGISYDAFESVAIGMGKRMLHYGATRTYAEYIEKIESITAEELLLAARTFFKPEELTTLIYAG